VKPAAQPPADIKEGQIVIAKIVSINKVVSQWKDDEGNPREQLEFNLELDGGYRFKTWATFYQQPTEKTKIGKLALTLEKTTGKKLNNIEEFLTVLKSYNQVFAKCTGYREYEEEVFPNFTIVTDKLPEVEKPAPKQTKIPEVETRELDAKAILSREPFVSAVNFGFPLNQDDFNKNLSVEERVFLFKNGFIEKRLELFYFTSKATNLFQ
jgi:hypothetical protein